jgi:diguanylate cyclase (GGDEF)-like protein
MILASFVQLKLIKIVNLQLRIGQVTELIVFSIVFASVWNYVNHPLLLGWYAFSVFSCFARFYLTYYTDKKIILIDESIHKLKIILAVSAFLAGVSWGFVGSVFMPAQDFAKELFCFFLLIGSIAAATIFYSGVKNTYIYFLLPAYVPHLLWVFSKGPAYYEIVGCGVLYFFMMMGLSIYINRFVTSSVTLQFINNDLIEDLSNAKKQLEFYNHKLTLEARLDHLTSLPNRKSLFAKMDQLLRAYPTNKQNFAVLFCDIDFFKLVNDNYGHDVGDAVLVQMAASLQAAIGEKDFIARIGGDEFIILLDNVDHDVQVQARIREIMQKLKGYKNVMGQALEVQVSIGVSIYPYDGQNKKVLLKTADRALYQAKSAGRNQYILYSTLNR